MTVALNPWLRLVTLFAATITAVTAAHANSVCVRCNGPDAVYSCSVAPDTAGNTAVLGARQLQYSCIEDIARQYRHESCSVKQHQLGACNGEVHMMARPAPGPDLRPPPAAAAAATKGPPGVSTSQSPSQSAVEQTRTAPPSNEPAEPKTVVELAKRTADTTKKEIDRSAETVTKAARSTWRCITSFFSAC